MNPEALIQLLNDYGLPTALTLLFIMLYKGQNDKQTKYLFKTISELNDNEKYINELKKAININSAILERLKNSINDLNEAIKNSLNNKDS